MRISAPAGFARVRAKESFVKRRKRRGKGAEFVDADFAKMEKETAIGQTAANRSGRHNSSAGKCIGR
jgi:hypothetical protein